MDFWREDRSAYTWTTTDWKTLVQFCNKENTILELSMSAKAKGYLLQITSERRSMLRNPDELRSYLSNEESVDYSHRCQITCYDRALEQCLAQLLVREEIL